MLYYNYVQFNVFFYRELFFSFFVIFCRQEAINPNLQGTNVIKAKQLMDATIAQLNEHKNKVSKFVW